VVFGLGMMTWVFLEIGFWRCVSERENELWNWKSIRIKCILEWNGVPLNGRLFSIMGFLEVKKICIMEWNGVSGMNDL